MRKIILLIAGVLIFISCDEQRKKEEVSFTENLYNKFQYLYYSDRTSKIIVWDEDFNEIERIKDSLLLISDEEAYAYVDSKMKEYNKLRDSLYPPEKVSKIKQETLREFRSTITKESFEEKLSNWDGSLPSLVKFVKEKLNDPKSFKHVQTGYIIKGDYVEVKMIYRAKNSFNAVVKGSITVKVDGSGKLLEIIDYQ